MRSGFPSVPAVDTSSTPATNVLYSNPTDPFASGTTVANALDKLIIGQTALYTTIFVDFGAPAGGIGTQAWPLNDRQLVIDLADALRTMTGNAVYGISVQGTTSAPAGPAAVVPPGLILVWRCHDGFLDITDLGDFVVQTSLIPIPGQGFSSAMALTYCKAALSYQGPPGSTGVLVTVDTTIDTAAGNGLETVGGVLLFGLLSGSSTASFNGGGGIVTSRVNKDVDVFGILFCQGVFFDYFAGCTLVTCSEVHGSQCSVGQVSGWNITSATLTGGDSEFNDTHVNGPGGFNINAAGPFESESVTTGNFGEFSVSVIPPTNWIRNADCQGRRLTVVGSFPDYGMGLYLRSHNKVSLCSSATPETCDVYGIYQGQTDGSGHVSLASVKGKSTAFLCEPGLTFGAKSSLSFGGNFDTIFEIDEYGDIGDTAQMSTTADAGSPAGSVVVVGSDVMIHYQSGTSTVADMEALFVAAVSLAIGGNVVVKTPGTGANILAGPGDTHALTPFAGGAGLGDLYPGSTPGVFSNVPPASNAKACGRVRRLNNYSMYDLVLAVQEDGPITP